MRFALLFLALITALVAQTPTEPGNDWLIVPGVRVGPITAATTHADLVRLFGVTNVVDEDVTVSDAGPEPGTILYKDRPADSVIILWAAGKSKNLIDSLVFRGKKTCHWHTRDNITFGTTLKQLEIFNGGPFTLLGFGWDYEGALVSWNDGKLEKFLDRSCGGLQLRANPGLGDNPSSTDIALFRQVSGDKKFSSTVKTMQKLNPRVDWMAVSFENCKR